MYISAMHQNHAPDPLAMQIAQFFVAVYLPKLIKTIRKSLSMKSFGWIALLGALIALPFALAAILRLKGERAAHRRYDTNDYLFDDLS